MPEPNPFASIRTPWGSIPPSSGPAAGKDIPVPIPDHTLIRRIGKGSYGEVWLARNALRQYRAVKVVHRHSFDDDRPFEREFAGMQRFEPVSRTHESQLNILHVGRGADCFYYVMELADDMGHGSVIDEGTYTPRTLRSELLLRGRLPVEECLRLGLALSTALGHLHRHGLVHRDIKPSNIVFVNGIPKLADIGLVALAEGTRSFVGTEGYLPPEGPGKPQADLFGLGKVLYEIATGQDRQQFPELPTKFGQLPDCEALSEFNEVLMRACAPDPRQRYASAEEMHVDLALLQSGRSVARWRLVERRLRFAARAGALLTAAAVLAGMAFVYQRSQTREARRLAAENLGLAQEKTQLAEESTRLAVEANRLSEENRQRVVRHDIANGVRAMDAGDFPGALVWFADALPLLPIGSPQAGVHRLRIQQTLDHVPRLLQVLPHDDGLMSSAFSPDGRRIVTGTHHGQVSVWDAETGGREWGPRQMGSSVCDLRFSRDGHRVFADSIPRQFAFAGPGPVPGFFAILDAATGGEVFPAEQCVPGNSTNAPAAAFSPDDRWLAVSRLGGPVQVFDLQQGRPVAELRGHTGHVVFLAFSADGSLLASASLDRTVRLWRLPGGESVGAPLQHSLPVIRAILTDDGRHLVSAAMAREGTRMRPAGACEIQVWNVATGERVGEPLRRSEGWMRIGVEPGPAGRFFSLLHGDERLQLHNVGAGGVAEPGLKVDRLQCWDFSPDGNRVALGGDDNTALIFSRKTGETLAGPFGHQRWVHAVQFSPDGGRLLSASDDGTARVWDLHPRSAESAALRLAGPFQMGAAETVNRRGEAAGPFAVRSEGWRLIDPERLVEVGRLPGPKVGEQLRGILAGHTGHCWVLNPVGTEAEGPKLLYLWRQDGDQFLRFVLEHPQGFDHYTFSPDDRLLLTGGRDRMVRFWRTADGVLERSVRITGVDQGYVASISPDARVAIWNRFVDRGSDVLEWIDLESGGRLAGSRRLTGPIERIEFSPDGRLVALGDPSGRVTVLDGDNARVVSDSIKHTSNLSWVEWSPDSRRLLTAGYNDEILVWDADLGIQLLGPMRTPGGDVRAARWSPDGRFIVTRNDGRKVRIWEAATGEAVTPLLDHSGDVGFAFMTRDSRLITASEPNLIRAWELSPTTLPPEVLADYAKLASGRRLNAAGVMLSLTPLELGELARSLRQRAPELMRFQKTTAAQPSAEPRKRRISAAGRVRIPPAAKARWARFHAERAMMSGK